MNKLYIVIRVNENNYQKYLAGEVTYKFYRIAVRTETAEMAKAIVEKESGRKYHVIDVFAL